MATTEIENKASAAQLLAAMPKAELHLHLDGCLRPDTVADLAAEQGIALPVPRDQVASLLVAPDTCRDLMQVLSYFATPLEVLQTAQALERATYEVCQDVRRENVRYLEIRFGPSLHQTGGLSLAEIIAAVVRGWHAGRQAFGLTGGVILCALRQLPPDETQRVAQAGLPFLGQGVVAFDLAGDEAGFPILLHREPLLWAKSAGYGMTAHAGEAAGAQSVRDAVEVIGVSRVGHGVRSEEDPSLLPVLRERRVTLDMCPISNLQTHAVSSLAHHPLARYHRSGIQVSVNTDNRTVANTTMTRELDVSHQEIGLSVTELATMTLTAVRAGFAEKSDRETVVRDYRREMNELGIYPSTISTD